MKFPTSLLAVAMLVAMGTVTHGYRGCTIKVLRRSCKHRTVEGVAAICDGYGTEDKVPYNIDSNTVYMALRNFELKHLTRESFAHLQKVVCLSIVDSDVGSVDRDAFSAMTSLKELVLENTHMNDSQTAFVSHTTFFPELLSISESPSITRFDFQDLENLEQLKTLDIHGNGLQALEGDIFELIQNVEHLDLSDNGMAYVDWHQLNSLKVLTRLNLHGNAFQTIPAEVFAQFFAVKELTLADNPLHCNCKLAWLKRFFTGSQDKELDYPFVRCASPKAGSMADIPLEKFTCDQPSTPVINFRKLGTEDGRFEVNCTATGDPAPELSLRLPDGQMVLITPNADLSKLSTTSPSILTQPGVVECHAINTEGTATAQEQLPMPASSSTSLHSTVCLLSLLLASIIQAVM